MPRQPHILLITTDQQRADSLGCMGHPCVRTPHLDMLCAESVRFTHAYADCPVCIPARTTMITGIQAHRYGMPSYSAHYRIQRDRSLFLGSLLTAAGYQTHLAGKSHWHTDESFRGGFEAWTKFDGLDRLRLIRTGRPGMLTGIGMNEMSPMLSQFPPELCTTDWLVDRCQDVIAQRDRTAPLFLWASFIDPHPANQIHEPYYSMYDHEAVPSPADGDWTSETTCPYALRQLRIGNAHAHMKPSELRKARGVYYGMITNIDHQIGRLIGTLMRQGMWQDTLLVFTSDHGEMLGDHGSFYKSCFLDGAGRVPMIIRAPRWMEGDRGGVADGLVALADLLPTLCEAGGARIPEDVTGRSLLPMLRDAKIAVRDHLHGQIDNQHMFHDGRYKYLYFVDDGRELLFDTREDPRDERNLAGREALAGPMRARFIQHLAEEGHEHLKDGRLLNLGKALTKRDLGNVLGWMGLAGSA